MTKVETYTSKGGNLIRRVELRDGTFIESTVKGLSVHNQPVTSDDYDIAWLKSKEQPTAPKWRDEIRMVDLFSGTGPMTLGIVEAGRATGINVVPVFAIDFEKNAAMNYSYNFPKCNVVNDDILKFVDGELGEPITQAETDTLNMVGHVDMVIGGPPCQGHSDLNNHTRRNDPRNQLIFRVVRFVELSRPRFVIIENVQGIRHDKNHVLQTAESYLERLGYHLHENLLMASKFGVAQNRRRFILVATLDDKEFDLNQYERENVNGVCWAIRDLAQNDEKDIFNTSA